MAREHHFLPESSNPFTTALNFFVAILYTFVLQQYLGAVFGSVGRFSAPLAVLIVALLLEIIHYATEDYLYTNALNDKPEKGFVHYEVAQYLVHMAGAIALVGAAYVVILTLEPDQSVLWISDIPASRQVSALVLGGVSIQYATFACWQLLEGVKIYCAEATDRSQTNESKFWVPTFLAYSILLLVVAFGIVRGTTFAGFSLVQIAVFAALTTGFVFDWEYRVSETRLRIPVRLWKRHPDPFLPASGLPVSIWKGLYLLFALACVVAAWRGAPAPVLVGLLLLSLKTHYIYNWRQFYFRLLGLYPDLFGATDREVADALQHGDLWWSEVEENYRSRRE